MWCIFLVYKGFSSQNEAKRKDNRKNKKSLKKLFFGFALNFLWIRNCIERANEYLKILKWVWVSKICCNCMCILIWRDLNVMRNHVMYKWSLYEPYRSLLLFLFSKSPIIVKLFNAWLLVSMIPQTNFVVDISSKKKKKQNFFLSWRIPTHSYSYKNRLYAILPKSQIRIYFYMNAQDAFYRIFIHAMWCLKFQCKQNTFKR